MAVRMTAREREWRTQEDLSTLKRAAEINADRARTAAVRKAAEKEVAKLVNVTGVSRKKG